MEPTAAKSAPSWRPLAWSRIRLLGAEALAATIALACFSSAQAQTSGPMSASNPFPTNTNPTWQAGPVGLTFGGFTALESVYRSKNEVADIGSSYNSAIPFAYQANDYISEFRESARQSRFALLAQGPQGDAWSAQGYFETDFLSAGASSNSAESNSYTLRVRHFYGVLRNTESNWYLLAGQDWSYATLSTTGTMQPRTEQIPFTIDAQYVVGFNWTRNAQLRLVKLFGNVASLGISFESPQAAFTGATPATTVVNNTGGSLLNATTTYSIDFAPDVIAKFAVDPGFGHFELYGMGRGFRDRYEPTAGSVAGTNNTSYGGGIGAGMILPSASAPLYFQASGLLGDGIGRYGSGQLPDATVRPDGTVAALQEREVLVGLVGKPIPTLQIYAYGGLEQAARDAFVSAKGTLYGYGNPGYNNSGCDLETGSSSTCVANTETLKQLVLGEWWKAYQGAIGNFQIGLQYSYTDRLAFSGKGGAPSTSINMGFISFRYYPYQR